MNYNGQLTLMGILSGCFGGLFKFFLQVNTTSLWVGFAGVAFTALLSGAAGVAGKEIYVVVKKHIIKKYFTPNEPKTKNTGSDAEMV